MKKIIQSTGIKVLSGVYLFISIPLLIIYVFVAYQGDFSSFTISAILFNLITIATAIGLLVCSKVAYIMATLILMLNYALMTIFYFPEKFEVELDFELNGMDMNAIFVLVYTLFVIWQSYILLKKETRVLFYAST